MFWNQYPYLNLNDLNLDYILKAIGEMKYEVTNFVSINAIKYADPIQWDITSQYEKNTIVIDPVTGTAYISVAPVPAGVALTRPEYWTVVFDLGSFVTRAAQNFTSRWESETTTTATFPSATGDWLVWGDVLYKALTNITAGDTYVVNGNIEHFTIEDLYNAYLNTVAQILATIGDLNDLTTTDKSSVVNAINEIVTDFDNAIDYVTPEMFGAVGDGVTDDTQAIINALATNKMVYAARTYYVTEDITLNIGDTLFGASAFRSKIIFAAGHGFIVNGRYITVAHIQIAGTGGIGFDCSDDSQYTLYRLFLHDIDIRYFDTGIKFGQTNWDCLFENIKFDECKLGIDTLTSSASGMTITFINLHFNHCDQDVSLYGMRCCFIGCNFGVLKFPAITLANVTSCRFINCNFECDTNVPTSSDCMFKCAGRNIEFDGCWFKIDTVASNKIFDFYSTNDSVSFKDCLYMSLTGNLMPDSNFFPTSSPHAAVYGTIAFNGGCRTLPRPSYGMAQTPNWIDRENSKPICFYNNNIDKTKLFNGEMLYSFTSDCLCTYNGTNIVKVSDGSIIV